MNIKPTRRPPTHSNFHHLNNFTLSVYSNLSNKKEAKSFLVFKFFFKKIFQILFCYSCVKFYIKRRERNFNLKFLIQGETKIVNKT